jgi:triphosphoribosyl-dephospho-CoA synthetase
MEEKFFFDQNGVQVTNARFKVNTQTYAIRNITSTEVWTSKRKWALGALLVAMCIAAISSENYGIAVIFTGLSVWAFSAGRPKHHVKLRTSAGEAMALESRDHAYVVSVVSALNDAIVSQHRSAA